MYEQVNTICDGTIPRCPLFGATQERREVSFFLLFQKFKKKKRERPCRAGSTPVTTHSPQASPPRVLAGHPSRTLAVDGAAWSKTADQAARPSVPPAQSWDATNTDLPGTRSLLRSERRKAPAFPVNRQPPRAGAEARRRRGQMPEKPP